MELLTLEILRESQKQRKNRKSRHNLQSKQIEHRLSTELADKLEEYLSENDRVMLEVEPKFVGEFMNILDERFLSLYDYEQYDKNKFIFSNKELLI